MTECRANAAPTELAVCAGIPTERAAAAIASAGSGFFSPGIVIRRQAFYVACERSKKAGGVLGIHHADDEVERAVAPAGDDIGENRAGTGLCPPSSHSSQPGGTVSTSGPRAALQPRRPFDVPQSVGNGLGADSETR